MNIDESLKIFLALSQKTRLQIFKILLEYGRDGVAAGKIGERLDIRHNTLSFHLSHLTESGLIFSVKKGRSIIYIAQTEAIEKVIHFLNEACCVKESEQYTGKKQIKRNCF